jgi:lipopolysaccharide/colanic/teichoic acid biosynthesis glycosyltransferase
MSFVGSRPLTPDDSSVMLPENLVRLMVIPGLTGLWQVVARTTGDGREKLALDTIYAKHQNWHLDIKLILYTLPIVISPDFSHRLKLEDFVNLNK